MRGVLRPSFDAEIDLGDRAVTVALEEGRHLSLK